MGRSLVDGHYGVASAAGLTHQADSFIGNSGPPADSCGAPSVAPQKDCLIPIAVISTTITGGAECAADRVCFRWYCVRDFDADLLRDIGCIVDLDTEVAPCFRSLNVRAKAGSHVDSLFDGRSERLSSGAAIECQTWPGRAQCWPPTLGRADRTDVSSVRLCRHDRRRRIDSPCTRSHAASHRPLVASGRSTRAGQSYGISSAG